MRAPCRWGARYNNRSYSCWVPVSIPLHTTEKSLVVGALKHQLSSPKSPLCLPSSLPPPGAIGYIQKPSRIKLIRQKTYGRSWLSISARDSPVIWRTLVCSKCVLRTAGARGSWWADEGGKRKRFPPKSSGDLEMEKASRLTYATVLVFCWEK